MTKVVEDSNLSFKEHLVELRQRVIKSLIAVGVFFIIAYYYAERILFFITKPLLPYLSKDSTLVFKTLPSGFFLFFKIALITSLILATPVIVYQLFMFLAPGLYPHERRILKIILAIGFLSFATGFIFLYQFIFPLFFNFFKRFIFDFYELIPEASEYIDFVLKFNFYAGILFMIPFAIILAVFFNIISIDKFKELRKFFIIFAFFIAAAITPPDILSQIVISLLIIILYEVGIFFAHIKLIFKK